MDADHYDPAHPKCPDDCPDKGKWGAGQFPPGHHVHIIDAGEGSTVTGFYLAHGDPSPRDREAWEAGANQEYDAAVRAAREKRDKKLAWMPLPIPEDDLSVLAKWMEDGLGLPFEVDSERRTVYIDPDAIRKYYEEHKDEFSS